MEMSIEVRAVWKVLSKHLICRAHEWMMGRPTFRFMRELEDTQWLAPDELVELQRDKLKVLLIHAFDHAPYYREGFERRALDPRRMDSFECLQRLPFLDKPTIRRHLDELAPPRRRKRLKPYQTGGSTGEPLQFFLGRRRQAVDQALRVRTHRWFGVDLGDPELWLWGSPIELSGADRLKRLRDRLFNHRLLNAFNMSAQTMDRYWGVFQRYRPRALFGYPSSLALWSRHLQCQNVDTRDHRLKAIFVTGEVCDRRQKETIETCFNAPVVDGYGSREGGFIAHECERGAMHVMAESVLVEIVVGEEPAPPGQWGEIVITHLDAYGMPFIRYRTGDQGRRWPGRCGCGRGLPLMDKVRGRRTDFIHLPDGSSKHALSVIYPLRETAGVIQFQVIQERDYTLHVEVVVDPNSAPRACHSIRAALSNVVGHAVPVHVRPTPHIAQAPSGKHRQVISRVVTDAPALLDVADPSFLHPSPEVEHDHVASNA